jgi:hypothetical protein
VPPAAAGGSQRQNTASVSFGAHAFKHGLLILFIVTFDDDLVTLGHTHFRPLRLFTSDTRRLTPDT